jgi:hypothetical protein
MMIRPTLRCAATCIALLLVGLPASAQTAALATNFSAQHLVYAREVADASGLTKPLDAIVQDVVRSLEQMNVTRPEIRNDLHAVIEALRPELEKQKQQMVELAARTVAGRMTEDELREVAGFFKSPVGQRYLETEPLILTDFVRDMGTWTQNIAEFAMHRARDEMGKKGHALQ